MLVSLEEAIAVELATLAKDGDGEWRLGFSLTVQDSVGTECFGSAVELPIGKLRDNISSIELSYSGRGTLVGKASILVRFYHDPEDTYFKVTISGPDARLRASRLRDVIEIACANHGAHNEFISWGGGHLDPLLGLVALVCLIQVVTGLLSSKSPPPSPVAIAAALLCVVAFVVRNVYLTYSVFDTTLADKNADTGKWLTRLLFAGIIITPFINWIRSALFGS